MNLKELSTKLEECQNRDILSDAVINNPDRDILSVVLECYSNLADTFLAAYTLEIADQEAQFKMEYKEYIQKWKKQVENNDITTDITNLENGYYELKLVYVMHPRLVDDKYKITSLTNTINEFDDRVANYKYFNSTLKEELAKWKTKYENNPKIAEKFVSPTDSEGKTSLFVDEQSIIIPMLHKTGKYKIDGYNYYGVYNDASGTLWTQNGTFSFKLTRRGSSYTYYMAIEEVKLDKKKVEERLVIPHFGTDVNPFFFLSMGKLCEQKQEVIIPYTSNEKFNEILDNTWREALRLEELNEHPPYGVISRVAKTEYSFRNGFIQKIQDMASQLDDNLVVIPVEEEKEFIHLANLDQSIYNSINNERRRISVNKLAPSDVVKRKNLSPMNIHTTIKQGYNSSRSNRQTQMFESSTTAPNPIDLYKLFQYIKIGHHTETADKPKRTANNNQVPIQAQLVRIGNLKYLGTFAPKNANNMESSLVLHFNIDKKNIIYRNERYKSIFTDHNGKGDK